ncbi:hypothetical protein DD592_27195 [Enterobacter cloacae complex sp. 2DZ2F20B]|nr:hypothetical protein DD592_27195 [Enterobacter cloacae complex sp. 2DZ2F20B]
MLLIFVFSLCSLFLRSHNVVKQDKINYIIIIIVVIMINKENSVFSVKFFIILVINMFSVLNVITFDINIFFEQILIYKILCKNVYLFILKFSEK